MSQVDEIVIEHKLEHQGSTAGFFGATPTTQPAAPTAADTGTVDILYGVAERDVILNMRTRLNEVVSGLQSLGLLDT